MKYENLTGEKKRQSGKNLSRARHLPVFLLFLLVPTLLHGHSETRRSLKEVISHAETVAIARISRIEKDARRCSTRTRIFVTPLHFLKGSCSEKSLTFTSTTYQWKQARFFWQKDCPSVHYQIPPRLRNPKKGQEAVVTIQYFKEYKKHFVTSMSRMDKLPSIKKMLSKP